MFKIRIKNLTEKCYDSSEEKLQEIAIYLNLIPPIERRKIENWFRLDSTFLLELLVSQNAFRFIEIVRICFELDMLYRRYQDMNEGLRN